MNRSINDLFISKRDVEKIALYREINKITSAKYERMSEEPFLTPKEVHRYMNKSWSVAHCNDFWLFDFHTQLKIKDKKGAISCKDKFCPICQKTIQASRLVRFDPELNKIAQTHDIYHLTLTVPNIKIKKTYSRGDNLNEVKEKLDAMFDNFKKLVDYIRCKVRIVGLDFAQYGYAGALRNLEIKVNDFELHPHIHALFAFEKGATFPGENKNKFSFKRDGSITFFSDFEILVQKIWYLINNNQRVTSKSINDLPCGYSCRLVKKSEGEYAEIFKYVTKTEEGFDIPYEVFSTLVGWLYNRRCFQGYGCFYRIQPDDNIDNSMNTIYDRLKQYMVVTDKPFTVHENLDGILFNMITGDVLYITRAKIAGILRQLYSDGELDNMGELAFVNDYLPKQKITLVNEVEFTPEQLTILELIKPFIDNRVQNDVEGVQDTSIRKITLLRINMCKMIAISGVL